MVLEKIRMLLSEQMSIDEDAITIDMSFDEIGADALDVVELVMAVEQEFDIEIEDDVVEKITTVKDLVNVVNTFQ